MSVAFFQQSFLTNALTPFHKPNSRGNTRIAVNTISISCGGYQPNEPKVPPRKVENQFAKLAIVTLAAGVLTLGSVESASAAKTGGRIGGQAFRSSAPRSSGPRTNNSRTNVYINPPVAPPLIGGYGYGYGVPFYGGWGWSPFSFFAPGPSVAVGIGSGFELLALFLFLGAVSAVVRRFFGSREEEDED